MGQLSVPNRPFATEPTTGLMLPDGVFEATVGRQGLNADFHNVGASPTTADVYVESVSHPNVAVTPRTHHVEALAPGAARQLSWDADVSGVPPGAHRVAFVAEGDGGRDRFVKKILVTRVRFDESTATFTAETPQGDLSARFENLVRPGYAGCCPPPKDREKEAQADRVSTREHTFLDEFDEGEHDDDFEFCPPGALPGRMELGFAPDSPYEGQHGDLPFEDPWHKVVLCVVAFVLLVAAAVVAASEGGSVSVTTEDGTEPTPGAGGDCCGFDAEGGSSSYAVAGLVAAAAAAATAAGMSDDRGTFRRGQDETEPAGGEQTVREDVEMEFSYPEPVALGRPFVVDADWTYTRVTTGESYAHAGSDAGENQHVLSRYEVRAPDVVRTYRQEPFVVEGKFFDADGDPFVGGDLFVQCILAGPNGEHDRFVLQDDGLDPDDEPADGVFTGRYYFRRKDQPTGLWKYYVVAQDVNDADPDDEPEEAATHIGGIVLTHQLTVTFDPTEDCPFVPDGHVRVV